MKIKDPAKRLKQFWGLVDRKHIGAIAKHLEGKRVLDMGCGLGTTTDRISEMGYQCTGIDYEATAVEYCKKEYPSRDYREANAEALPFEDGYFDTIVLRDALHHFYGEADFAKVKKEILRVAKPGARIIFFDPNVGFLLRTMRKISAHKDEECDYETALKIMQDWNCKVIHSEFNTLYSLPLSGGYVGLNFVPNSRFIQRNMLRSEKFFEKLVNGIGMGRYFCWRYLIVGQRQDQ